MALALWALAALLLGAVVLGSVHFLGSRLASLFFDSLGWLVLVLGGLVALWLFGNLLITALPREASPVFWWLYEHHGPGIRASYLARVASKAGNGV